MRCLIALLCLISTSSNADVDQLITSTERTFPELPSVVQVESLEEFCGGQAHGPGIYCPTERIIYVVTTASPTKDIYTLAHLYGHAAQVTYGIADIALAAIRSEPEREAELRGMVTRQVECFAGSLVARADLQIPPLDTVFDDEPMTGSHWGRNPVREGPRVSIGLVARAEWFAIGYDAADPIVCSVGEMAIDLIVAADRE